MSLASRLILKARRIYLEECAARGEGGTPDGFRDYGHPFLTQWENDNPATAALLKKTERDEALNRGWRTQPKKGGKNGDEKQLVFEGMLVAEFVTRPRKGLKLNGEGEIDEHGEGFEKVSASIATIADYSAETDIHIHNRDLVNEEIAARVSALHIMVQRARGDMSVKLRDIAD